MRARLELRVLYDAPASFCGRVLHVLPLLHPSVELTSERLDIFPPPDSQSIDLDSWNNRRLRLFHRRIASEFRSRLETEANCTNSLPGFDSPLGWQKMPSRATPFAPELLSIARLHRSLAPLERTRHFNQLVFESLAYSSQPSERPATAGHIWTQKRGSCADFAHVLLSLCRASGLPARYVAGFGPAPGALHAWVEIAFEGAWHAFDPTHGREAVGLYLPVATGRDFYDCTPHQGRFQGQGARLGMRCELKAEEQV